MQSGQKFLLIILCLDAHLAASAAVESDLHQEVFHVEVSAAPPAATIFQPRDIVVSVQPKIGGIHIREVRLSTLGLLTSARPDLASIEGTSDQTSTLAANEVREYRFQVKPLGYSKVVSTPSLMRFPSGSQPMIALIHFDQPMAENDKIEKKTFEIQFISDDLSIAAGGCIGGFIASIFVLAVRFQNRKGSLRLAGATREILLNVVIGGGAAWILSYLGEITTRLNLGITLSATSFQGGVVIGLLSYKLGQALVTGITLSRT